MLWSVSLEVIKDYPRVLKHFRDHCPNLRSLTVTKQHLKSFPRSNSVLRNILERLERFEVAQRWQSFAPDDDSDEVPQVCLLELFQGPGPVFKMEHVYFDFETRNHSVLKKLLGYMPSLVSVRMPLCVNCIYRQDYLSSCERLESIRGLKLKKGINWFHFGIKWLSKHHSLNLTFKCSDEAWITYFDGELPLLRLMHRDSQLDLMEFLTRKDFKQLKKPISAWHFIDVLMEGLLGNSLGVRSVLELALSPSAPRWFPDRNELARVLRTESPLFWAEIVFELPFESIEPLVRLVGPPEEINCIGLILAGMRQSPFDPAVMNLIRDLKLGSCYESRLALCNILERNFFFEVSSPEQLRWLLEFLDDDQSRFQLTEADEDTGHRTPVLQYCFDGRNDVLQALYDHFGDNATFLFSFPNNMDTFVQLGYYCANYKDLELLKRGVKATGADKISPAVRGILLSFLCKKLWPEQKEIHVSMLQYWIEVLSEGPEPDFYASDYIPPLLGIAFAQEEGADLSEVWIRFQKTIFSQVREKKCHMEELVVSFFHKVRSIERLGLAGKYPIDFYCNFFEELV
jgi:hypothetical protein